jgi:DNA-nicking Smr family endonuclease
MTKKKPKAHREEANTTAPKFSGFKPLAAGLGDLKAKLEAEEKAAKKAPAPKPQANKPRPVASTPPTSTRSTRSTQEERDDDLTFHRMMGGVTPIDRGLRVPVGEVPASERMPRKPFDIQKKAREEAEAVLEHLHHLVDDAVRFEVMDDGKRVEGRRLDVPPSLVRELRRGLMPIDGQLDLHGLGAVEARERLLDFLAAQRARGERCVLIIHGKGEHSVIPRQGVLRGEISAWLSQGRAREHVAAFATARENDGGEGAVYVALRR